MASMLLCYRTCRLIKQQYPQAYVLYPLWRTTFIMASVLSSCGLDQLHVLPYVCILLPPGGQWPHTRMSNTMSIELKYVWFSTFYERCNYCLLLWSTNLGEAFDLTPNNPYSPSPKNQINKTVIHWHVWKWNGACHTIHVVIVLLAPSMRNRNKHTSK